MSLPVNDTNALLLKYQLKPQSLSKNQLQKQILAIYGVLQLKIQENLFLKKDNLDLKLQINTIQQLFRTEIDHQQNGDLQDFQAQPDEQPVPLQQLIFSIHQSYPIQEQKTSQISDQDCAFAQNQLENSNWTLNGSAQRTQRKIINHKPTNLEEKIEKLFCQNQHILERLEELEENLNAQTAQKRESNRFDKNQKGRIKYEKQGKSEEDKKTNCTSQRASIYKWDLMNTATSRSSLYGKIK